MPKNPKAYVELTLPEGKRFEHVVLCEADLGRPLPPKAEVHHFDGNPHNNAPGNLVICQDRAYHFLLEARTRRLREFGTLDFKRCRSCKVVKLLDAFHKAKDVWDDRSACCKDCDNIGSNIRKRRWRAKRRLSAHV